MGAELQRAEACRRNPTVNTNPRSLFRRWRSDGIRWLAIQVGPHLCRTPPGVCSSLFSPRRRNESIVRTSRSPAGAVILSCAGKLSSAPRRPLTTILHRGRAFRAADGRDQSQVAILGSHRVRRRRFQGCWQRRALVARSERARAPLQTRPIPGRSYPEGASLFSSGARPCTPGAGAGDSRIAP